MENQKTILRKVDKLELKILNAIEEMINNDEESNYTPIEINTAIINAFRNVNDNRFYDELNVNDKKVFLPKVKIIPATEYIGTVVLYPELFESVIVVYEIIEPFVVVSDMKTKIKIRNEFIFEQKTLFPQLKNFIEYCKTEKIICKYE